MFSFSKLENTENEWNESTVFVDKNETQMKFQDMLNHDEATAQFNVEETMYTFVKKAKASGNYTHELFWESSKEE